MNETTTNEEITRQFIDAEANYHIELHQLRRGLWGFWMAAKEFKKHHGHEHAPSEFGFAVADVLSDDTIVTQAEADKAQWAMIHHIRENRTTVVLPRNRSL